MDLYKKPLHRLASLEWMSVFNSTEWSSDSSMYGFAALHIMEVAEARCTEIFMRTAVWVDVYVRSET